MDSGASMVAGYITAVSSAGPTCQPVSPPLVLIKDDAQAVGGDRPVKPFRRRVGPRGAVLHHGAGEKPDMVLMEAGRRKQGRKDVF